MHISTEYVNLQVRERVFARIRPRVCTNTRHGRSLSHKPWWFTLSSGRIYPSANCCNLANVPCRLVYSWKLIGPKRRASIHLRASARKNTPFFPFSAEIILITNLDRYSATLCFKQWHPGPEMEIVLFL